MSGVIEQSTLQSIQAVTSVIASVAAVLALVVSVVFGILNRRAIGHVHIDLNSRLTELVAAEKAAAHAAGRLDVHAEQELWRNAAASIEAQDILEQHEERGGSGG